MGQSLAAQLGNNLLVRTGVVTLVLVGVFAVATGALPVRCMIGGNCSVANLPAAPTRTVAEATPKSAVLPGLADVAVVKPVIQKVAPPSLTHNDVLAGTFAQLKVELKAPVATSASRLAKATGPNLPETDSGLTTRMVRAVTINPDGTPNLGMAEAYANIGGSPPVVRPSPALDAAVRIGAGQVPAAEEMVATAEPEPAAKPDTDAAPTSTPAAKGTATVVGKGANVRANPSRAGKVLFALSGGETVKIVENRRGWLHVSDDQGRSGWIYSDFVKRGG